MSQITNSKEFTEKELKENSIAKMEFLDDKVNELNSMKHDTGSASYEAPVDEIADNTEEVALPKSEDPTSNIPDLIHQAVSEAIMTERASYMNRFNRDKYESEYRKTHNVIKSIIEKWCKEANIKSPITYNISNGSYGDLGTNASGTNASMIIYTTEVNKMLGESGNLFEKYSAELNDYFTNFLDTEYTILVNPVSRFINLNVFEGPDFD